MKFKGIVFDMDGTIFDSEQQYEKAFFYAAECMGVDFSEEFFFSFCGRQRNAIERICKDRYGEDFDFERFVKLKEEYTEKLRKTEGIPLKKGFWELINFLKENNIPYIIASSTSTKRLKGMLETAGVADCFKKFIGGDVVENGKPAPDIFLLAAETIGVKPNECIGVEDSQNGIVAVRAANMTSVFIPDCIAPNDIIRKSSDYILNSLDEIISLF